MAFSFESVIKSMQSMGVYEYVLPFLLVFSIIFAILEKTKVLGEGKSNINGLVSFVIGLVLIAQQTVVATINRFLPRFSLILIVFLSVMILISFIAGNKFKGLKGSWLIVFVIVGIIAIAISLSEDGSSSNWLSEQDDDTLMVGGLIIVFVIIAWFIVKGGNAPENQEGKLTKFMKSLDNSTRE